MISNGKNVNVTCMERICDGPAIRFTNVFNNEIFAFSLVLVKGYILGFDRNSNGVEHLIVRRVKQNKPVNEFIYRLRCDEFSVLLSLEAGENEFSFCISNYSISRTYYYVSSAHSLIVTPVFIVCRDGNESADSEDLTNSLTKITIGCRLIQTLIAESLFKSGHGRKTFSLECADSNGNSNCIVFQSALSVNATADMSAEDLWEYFGRELMTSEYGSTKRKFLAFVSPKKGKCTKQLAIGGGGLALCDLQFLETWPTTIEDIRAYFGYRDIDNNANRWQTRLASFSTSLGAVCHELCHTFDLGHTLNGIMGRDFDRVSSIFLSTPISAAMNAPNLVHDFDKKDRLVISKGTSRRTLNINYSVNNNLIDQGSECGDQGAVNVSNEHHFWSGGCAMLLSHHRWITGLNDISGNVNHITSFDNSALRYDHIRGIITSTHSIVVVQLRRQCGFVLKSWEFSARRNKILFLVPLYEARRASMIIVEDIEGNLLKKDLQNLF